MVRSFSRFLRSLLTVQKYRALYRSTFLPVPALLKPSLHVPNEPDIKLKVAGILFWENNHVNMHYTCTTIDADTVPARFYPRILRSLDMSTDNYCFKGTCHSTTNTWVEEEDENISIAVPGTRTPRQNLSGMRRNHSVESFAFIPESGKGVGLTNTLSKSKSHTDCCRMAPDMSDQQILQKNNGKPTIDVNFFKSMAKTIKANRASKAGAEVVDDKACTHYIGYTSNSCGEKTRYVDWLRVEGEAMRVRVELKFGLLHERMLAHP